MFAMQAPGLEGNGDMRITCAQALAIVESVFALCVSKCIAL